MHAVEDVSFDVQPGQTLGLVGESGCGKTTTMMSLMRLLPAAGRITRGQVLFDGIDLLGISERQMRHYRWKEMAMVFQSAMNALNPVRKVGDQIARSDCAARPDGSRSRPIGAWWTYWIWSALPRAQRSISASIFRRYAAARHDRNGVGVQAEVIVCRRAYHGVRRDDSGSNSGAVARHSTGDWGWRSCWSHTIWVSSPRSAIVWW